MIFFVPSCVSLASHVPSNAAERACDSVCCNHSATSVSRLRCQALTQGLHGNDDGNELPTVRKALIAYTRKCEAIRTCHETRQRACMHVAVTTTLLEISFKHLRRDQSCSCSRSFARCCLSLLEFLYNQAPRGKNLQGERTPRQGSAGGARAGGGGP